MDRSTQTFELEVLGPDGRYTYRLLLRHGQADGGSIEYEKLSYEGRDLYSCFRELVTLQPEDGGEPVHFPAGRRVSALSNLPQKFRSKQIAWVLDRMHRIWVLRPVPQTLDAVAHDGKGDFLERDLSNFASWLLAMQGARATFARSLKRSLRIVLEGFRDYEFEPQGRGSYLLQFSFASPRRRGRVPFAFSELSEGQRALVVLYALLHAVSGEASTLCIDEPENFLSPREIQPWLNRLMDET
jgi:hypothetical protein